jgi:hypothetical protein
MINIVHSHIISTLPYEINVTTDKLCRCSTYCGFTYESDG